MEAGGTPVLVHNCNEVDVPSGGYQRLGNVKRAFSKLPDRLKLNANGEPRTYGHYYEEGADSPTEVISGHNTPKPAGFKPATSDYNWHHAEMQAVSMLNESESNSATLYITQNYVCRACMGLEQTLKKGNTLTVVYSDIRGIPRALEFAGEG
ncbi:DddA-like double-stranded DNA deaminase toxin [Streptomyces malaysiense]|uniref:DddA-like double-stranded DNA deaminase toxin n=1 Tax=Streptomyces malaysiense TaxID=1428626 RepID=UPI00142DCD11